MSRSKFSVVIPSVGRPGVLLEALRSLANQTLLPAETIVCVTQNEDIPSGITHAGDVRFVFSQRGSSVQRNCAISCLNDSSDYVLFLDDDVLLAANYCEVIMSALSEADEFVAASGNVLIESASLAISEEAVRRSSSTLPTMEIAQATSLYGCNFCVRRSLLSSAKFDEELPLYGWLEDHDFAWQVGRHGQIGYCPGAAIAHLKVPSGRTSGLRFGYSQIANPLYLWKKGSIGSLYQVLLRHWMPAIARNFVSAMMREQELDRHRRLRGNFLALLDAWRRNVSPGRVAKLA